MCRSLEHCGPGHLSIIMGRPIPKVFVFNGLVILASGVVWAEDAATAKPERAVSRRVADLLSASAPKFEPSTLPAAENVIDPQASAARARVSAPEITTPANTIIRLPDYIVRE